jgi:hypothetical protein
VSASGRGYINVEDFVAKLAAQIGRFLTNRHKATDQIQEVVKWREQIPLETRLILGGALRRAGERAIQLAARVEHRHCGWLVPLSWPPVLHVL